MKPICLVDLGEADRSGYIVGACLPLTDPAYSPCLDIAFYRQSWGWSDGVSHLHTGSEEFLIVLNGRIDLLINQSIISVHAGNLLGMRAGVAHKILHVEAPVETLTIRIPGGGNDIVYSNRQASQPSEINPDREVILLDLHQIMHDYPVGACLPKCHPNYTPCLDLSCVWGVEPGQEWPNDKAHLHTYREEYYFLLRGRMEFEVDGEPLTLFQNQVLGIRPPRSHRIAGGQGPADLFILRVPGGRDDKVYG